VPRVARVTTITAASPAPALVGRLLRDWRERRRLTQLDLALRAEVSARHLSFVETGRSRPTSEMILRLARHLDVPLRDRNVLLLSGYPRDARLDGGTAFLPKPFRPSALVVKVQRILHPGAPRERAVAAHPQRAKAEAARLPVLPAAGDLIH